MNDATTTIPETFEEYAAELGLDNPDDPRRGEARARWEAERTAVETYPDVIPPCPSWCALPAGHGYDSYDTDGRTHYRFHTAPEGGPGPLVESMESYNDGAVTLTDPKVDVMQKTEALTAEEARSNAAQLLAAADLLDSITGP